MIRKITLYSLLCLSSFVYGDFVQRFPFPIGSSAIYKPRGHFIIGAATAVPNNNFSVAASGRSRNNFVGLTPEKVVLNNESGQVNPLHGVAIEHLALLDRRPVVIPNTVPSSLFLIEERGGPKVFQSAPLRNANGEVAPSVLALTTAVHEGVIEMPAGSSLAAIAAVPNVEGTFEGNGSGIALAFFREVVNEQTNRKFFTWDVVDANTSVSSFTKEGIRTDHPLEFSLPRPALLSMPRPFFEKYQTCKCRPDIYTRDLVKTLIHDYVPPQQSKTVDDEVIPEEINTEGLDELLPISTPLYLLVRYYEEYAAPFRRKLLEHDYVSELLKGPEKSMGNKAKPFSKDTPELFINEPVSILENAVDLHFDRELGRLYIATKVTAGEGEDAGARAIVVASIADGQVLYHPIAIDSAFDGQDHIVGSKGPLSKTSIFKVRTMQTRTYLRYLIVVGGNGTDPKLSQSVFAMPLIDNIYKPQKDENKPQLDIKKPEHGTLADVTAKPVTGFSKKSPHRFESRVFAKPATSPNELFTMNSPAAKVGGNGVLPGPISDIQIEGEAVFVSCDRDADLNKEGLSEGIFYSQPIFDVLGRISGWTDWHRVANSNVPIFGFGYDPFIGIFWQIPSNDGMPKEVFKNKWTEGEDPFDTFISMNLGKSKGGVQGLFDFPYTTESFSQDPAERISVEAFTGYKKIILTQTGKSIDGLFTAFNDVKDTFERTDGTMKGFSKASNLVFSGGVLSKLGPIIAATVVSDGTNNGWFVVAGSGGIAVLADSQGRGWQELGSGFKGLTGAHRWQRISSTRNVRKLIVQDGQLFSVSQQKLERISLTQESIAQGQVRSVLLSELTKDEICEAQSYSDLHIKGPLGLLATSVGLLRSGSGIDIRSAQDMKAVQWTQVPLLESVGNLDSFGPVSRIVSISVSDPQAEDNLYILNAYVGLSQALIYRLVLTLVNGAVTDNTVRLFPDFILKDINSFFSNLGDYRNYLVTDGALIAVSRSSFSGNRPLVELLPPTLKSGESVSPRSRVPFIILPENSCTIRKLVRSSASGAWLAPGDFGVRVQK